MPLSGSMPSDEDAIRQRLAQFFDAMGAWEAHCQASHRSVKTGAVDYEAAKADWIARLLAIFRDHCTTWEAPARTRQGIHFSTIRVYGSDLEAVESVEIAGDRARVVTQQAKGPRDRLVYRLRKCGGDWRIEDNRQRIGPNGKETDWDL